MFLQHIKHKLYMLQVFLICLAEDTYIIQIDNHKFVEVGCKDLVHHTLKSGWRVSQAKAERTELEMTKGGAKSSLWHIVGMKLYLMVCLP